MVQFQFDATNIKPLGEYAALPEGQYLVEITQSTKNQTKAGDGSYLEFEYLVLEGEHKGAKHWDRFCFAHPNPKAVDRANAALSAICYAIGVPGFTETVELHHLPFLITIRHKTSDEGRASANVVGYAPRPTFAQQPSQPNQPTGPGPRPWKAKQ